MLFNDVSHYTDQPQSPKLGENNVAPAPAFIVAQWIASAYGRDAEALSYLCGYRKLDHLRAAELVPC